jgi:hypothetical protein
LTTENALTRSRALFILVVLAFGHLRLAKAQDNYEIQVYGSDTVAPKTTMPELHSNFTVEGSQPAPGSQFTAEGVYPTNHAEHETVEITQGLTSWSEVTISGAVRRDLRGSRAVDPRLTEMVFDLFPARTGGFQILLCIALDLGLPVLAAL